MKRSPYRVVRIPASQGAYASWAWFVDRATTRTVATNRSPFGLFSSSVQGPGTKGGARCSAGTRT